MSLKSQSHTNSRTTELYHPFPYHSNKNTLMHGECRTFFMSYIQVRKVCFVTTNQMQEHSE